MTSRRLVLILSICAIGCALCVIPLLSIEAQQPNEHTLPLIAPAPTFSLIDSTGQTFSSDSLREKVWVADFMFTNCPGACPIMTGQLSRLNRIFAEEPDFVMASISVDPERDTPEALAKYAQDHDADTTRWRFLTGPMAEINRLSDVSGFKLGTVTKPAEHSLRYVLVDRAGMIRGYYDSGDDAILVDMIDDIVALLREPVGADHS